MRHLLILMAVLLCAHATCDVVTGQTRRVRRAPAGVEAPPPPPLDEAQKASIIDAMLRRIDESYLFQDSVAVIASFFRDQRAVGAYRDIEDVNAFARQLTDDLRTLTNDLHFAVRYEPDRYEQFAAMLGEDGAMPDRFGPDARPQVDPASPFYQELWERYRRVNFYFRKVENLAGNVGYLKVDQMPPLEIARPTVDAALAFLANSDAVILDLRNTPGGVGGFVPYLASYFLPADSMLLYAREFGAADTTVTFHAYEHLPGQRLADVPLYILTNGFTGSAAENLAYTLKHHGRAAVVGQATAGAAHSATVAPLADGFTMRIPMARVVHPVTNSNWERIGVQPDVEAASDDALRVGHRLALETLLAQVDDPGRRTDYQQALQALDNDEAAQPVAEDTAEDLAPYVGTFGDRQVRLENGRLVFEPQVGPTLPLKRVEGDLFELELPRGAAAPGPIPKLRFERDAQGHVHALSFVNDAGQVERTYERVE